MPTPSGGPVKSGSCRSESGSDDFERADRGHQHEDAPQAVDDRGNRGEQLGEEHERLAQRSRTELGDEDRDAERDRRRDQQRQDRRVERAPDERQRAELARRPDPRSRCARSSRPNFWIDSIDWRASSKPMRARRSATSTKPNAPVPILNPRSLRSLRVMPATLRRLDLRKRRHLELHDRLRQRRVAELARRTSGRRSAPTS